MWYSKSTKEVIKELNTNEKLGLNDQEVKIRQEKYGLNQLKEKKKESIFKKFIKQFNDFMIIILIIASITSAIMAYIQKTGDYADSFIIIGIVIFNAIMGLVQEEKAEKSLEALKKMSSPKARVRRNGRIDDINSNELVPGDIVILESGNYIPADCRLIKTYNLKVEESSLTGENLPVEKNENDIINEETSIGDIKNMAFLSTVIVNGHGEAIVTDTGMNTQIGKIANMIIEDKSPETPIQKKLAGVGKSLGIGCIVICALIFIIGIFKKIPIGEMFMTSIGLAVAAIPEGLPAIVTIMLSIGVTKMARKNAIIRKLPAVETLGSSSVICSDKTGTLTENKMSVVEIKNVDGSVDDKIKNLIINLGNMCTNTEKSYDKRGNLIKIVGEATEVAIVNKAINLNILNNNDFEKVGEVPFDSKRKMMSVIYRIGNSYQLITKGAPDFLFAKSKYYDQNGETISFDNIRNKIENQNNNMAEKALRVIGVAYKKLDNLPQKIDESIENNLTFVGLIGMMDKPREGVKEAITTCRNAGIKTVMITGDYIATAKAIAKDLGILRKNDLAIDGKTLDEISEKELEKNIMQYSVFARVSPEHKVRIVKAFRKNGQIVAMTGDGVNDAPALKNADIGIAMGKSGTDVAKNASDMILADDNFITIVGAVKQGRNIYDNIVKAIHFLISTNIGEIVAILLGLLIGVKSPLLAIQLLWVNLVTDSLPAIAIGLEKEEKNIMLKRPRKNNKSLFADGLWGRIISEGFMIGMLTLTAFFVGNKLSGINVGRTMAFLVLGISELVHSFNIKSEESIFKSGLLENKYLVGAFALGCILQIGVVIIKPISDIFYLTDLNNIEWIITIFLSIFPIFIIEIQKAFNSYKFGKIIYNTDLKRI